MGLETRKDILGVDTNIDTRQIYRTSRLVSDITGFPVQPNKAIVGDNAFAHAAGIHQHGMLSDRATYEIMTPETVGAPPTQLVLGKHSGRHALRHRYQKLGIDLNEEEMVEASLHCTDLAERRIDVTDEALLSILHKIKGEESQARAGTPGASGSRIYR
jgi:2-isopropylmalate synthase